MFLSSYSETYWGDVDFCTISNQGICTIQHPFPIFFCVSKGTIISLLRRKSCAIKLESSGTMLSFGRIVRVLHTPILTHNQSKLAIPFQLALNANPKFVGLSLGKITEIIGPASGNLPTNYEVVDSGDNIIRSRAKPIRNFTAHDKSGVRTGVNNLPEKKNLGRH